MTERQEERTEPEEKAEQPSGGAPEFENVQEGSVPDPSGDQEISESDRDNPMVNDSSFESGEDKDRER